MSRNNDSQTHNTDSSKQGRTPHSGEEIQGEAKKRLSRINEEFVSGFDFIKNYPRSVTFFGSSRMSTDNPLYEKANRIAKRIAKAGYAVVTGGGPGIMEASNRGAYEYGGMSVGLNIKLPTEQNLNEYVSDSMGFYYFFARKVILAFSAEAFLFFPGGYGTLDELFEILTLMQTGKIPQVPVCLVGEEYWNRLDEFMQHTLEEEYKTISPEDRDLYTITDDEDRIVETAISAPKRKE